MNVIVSNKQKNIIDNANIDAIKDLNGLFNVDDLISKFKNYFYSKMILDATSVINFTDPEVLEKLSREIGGDKLVILLPSSPEPPKEFIDKLLSLNIVKFSTNIEDIVKFLDQSNNIEDTQIRSNEIPSINQNVVLNDNSNQDNFSQNNMTSNLNNNINNSNFSYSDAMSNMNIQNNVANTNNFNNTSQNVDYNNIANSSFNNINANYSNDMNLNNMNANINYNNSVMNGSVNNMNPNFNYNNGMTGNGNFNNSGANNFNPSINSVNYSVNNANNLNTNFSYANNASNVQMSYSNNQNISMKRVIGLKNVTEHAGSTTLVYLLVKTVNEVFNKKCIGIELNKNDFAYFQNNSLKSDTESNISSLIQSNNADLFFVDLNNTNNYTYCTDVLYLMEPSIIKLNKLMADNRNVFVVLNGKKIVLNQSLLSNNDVVTLSREAGINFFYNLPPLNDRIRNNEIVKLLSALNIK